jgi:putative DNA primase/helicase
VTAVETEEGRRWDESKIKALTGGDAISARFMRQDFFQYTPQFKLVIAGNHKPGLRSVDEAIRRRFNLIPFTVTIPPEERDPELGEKLKAELPGIMAWMIDGCIAWQQQGLNQPEIVTAATEAYLEAEDGVAAWLEECCQRDPNAFTTNTSLFTSWSDWAGANGEYVGTTKKLVSTRGGRIARGALSACGSRQQTLGRSEGDGSDGASHIGRMRVCARARLRAITESPSLPSTFCSPGRREVCIA